MQEDDYTSGGLLSTAVWEKQGVISSANGGDMDSWSPTLDTMKPCQGWGTRHTATFISPVPKSEGPGAPSVWCRKIIEIGVTRHRAIPP
jgi:hypothetical protein